MNTASASPSATVRCASSLVEGEDQLPEEHLSLREAIQSACEIEKTRIDSLYPLVDKLLMNDEERINISDLSLLAGYSTFNGGQMLKISLRFYSSDAYSIWKTCFTAGLFDLDLPDALESSQSVLSYLTNSIVLSCRMELGAMQSVLEYLKPLFRRSFFEKITIGVGIGVPFQTWEDMLDVGSVKVIEFSSAKQEDVKNFEPLAKLVQKIEPSSIIFYGLDLTSALENCLVNVAEVADAFEILNCHTTRGDPLPTQILKGILTKGCRKLHVFNTSFKYSRAQVVELVEFLQDTGKRVSLFIPTESDIIEDKIGDFSLKYAKKKDSMFIKHCEMDSKAADNLLKRNSTQCLDPPAAKRKAIESNSVNAILAIRHILDTAQKQQSLREKNLFDFEKEFTMDRSKKIVVESLTLSHRNSFKEEFVFSFSFSVTLDQNMWEAFFNGALSKIGAAEGSVRSSELKAGYNFRVLSWTQSTAIGELANLRRLAIILKWLANRTIFKTILFDTSSLEMANFCADLTDGSEVKMIEIRSWMFNGTAEEAANEDFSHWIRMIRKVRPIEITYWPVRLTNGLMQFLVNVADIVQKIRVHFPTDRNSGAFPISFVHKLCWGSACNCVQIYDRVTQITTYETEQLIQLFHHFEKKMAVLLPIAPPLQVSTIGEYTICSTFGNLLKITHANH